MSYKVLALKWRPQGFEDVVGQETVTRTLRNAIEQDRTAHAFLFSGVRGVGKTSTARILAKALNCAKGPTTSPCGECPACVEIAASTNLDVLEIDGASNNGVEQVRDLVEASRYAPSRDRYKIYIIDEVHMLSTAAFNALLKTLEEPPPRVKFIFATTEYHKIPDTIVSRCQQFEFRTVPSLVIADQLRKIAEQEGIDISEAALSQVGRAAEGSLRDALSALDQVLAAVGAHVEEKDVAELLGLIDLEILAATARAITERDTARVLSIVNDVVVGGRDLRSFARGLVQYFRDLLVVRAAPELVELSGDREELSELANQLSEDEVIRSIDLLTQLEGALRWAPEPRFHLEVALLKLAQLRQLASFEDLLARLEALESGTTPAPRSTPPARSSSGSKPRVTKQAPAKPSPPPRTATAAPPVASTENRVAAADASPAEDLVARILERLRSVNPKVHALLSHHDGVSLDGDCLRVGFDASQEFSRTKLARDDLREVLAKTASECAGRKLRIEIASSQGESQKAPQVEPTSPPAPKENGLREKVLEEPLVRSFLETFQGEIEEVRSLDASSESQSSEPSDKR